LETIFELSHFCYIKIDVAVNCIYPHKTDYLDSLTSGPNA